MTSDVKVKIDVTKVTGKDGFGCPLILKENATQAVEYIECSNLAEVVEAGFTSTTDVYKTAALIFMQDNTPSKIAICATDSTAVNWLGDVQNTTKEWRQLIVLAGDGEAATVDVANIIPVIEALDGKMFFASLKVDDTTEIAVTGVERTVLFYCTDANTEPYPAPAAALVGATAGLDAGSFTYKNVILNGITAQSLTGTQIDAIHKKGGITFVTKAGDNVTSEGKVAGGEYIDIIDSEDYIIQQLTYKTQKLFNTQKKVPYDNNGIAMLESVAIDVMQTAYNKGMIATSSDGKPDFSVTYAKREEVSDADRAERKYFGGTFSFALAGAIHYAEITGEIIV